MKAFKVLKQITQIPLLVEDTWRLIRDNGIDESISHSRQRKHYEEMIEKINLLNKSQDTIIEMLTHRLSRINMTLENIEDTMTTISKDIDAKDNHRILKDILQDHFDNISIDLDNYEVSCTSEHAMDALHDEVQEMLSILQESQQKNKENVEYKTTAETVLSQAKEN